jgi:hypothetical protein
MGVRNGEIGSRGGSSGMLSGMAGALIGAAGLAWWLLSEAEKRRLDGRQQRVLRLSRSPDADDFDPSVNSRPLSSIQGQKDLHDKVHELNQAIEDVRRQLEGMATSR